MFAVVRASQHICFPPQGFSGQQRFLSSSIIISIKAGRCKLTPWGTLYHGPSFSRQRRRWHCLPYNDHTDWRRHTAPGVSASKPERADAVIWFFWWWSYQLLTLDFFNLQRSQALQTLLRTLLSECELSDVGVDCRAVIVYSGIVYSRV